MNSGFHAPYPPMNGFMPPQPFAVPFNKGPTNQQNLTLYIGDLEEQISEEFLYPYFSKFGPIFSLKIMRDRYLRKSRGFGFITFYNSSDVEKAKTNANHDTILTRPIRVIDHRAPKSLPPDTANVFLKDLDKSIKIQDIDKALSRFGKIFSSKISIDDNGVSRGYGYVQFETEKEAEDCLAFLSHSSQVVNDKPLIVERYLPKSGRPNNAIQNNLYIKNLPKMPEGKTEKNYIEELKKELEEKFSQGGKRPITSSLVMNDGQGRFFSFICFEKNEDAAAALEEHNNHPIVFDCAPSTELLYVSLAEKKALRLKHLKERKFSRANETNLYTKGLKKSVEREDIEKIFSQFGKITSCMVRDSPDTRIDTRQAFINFESKEDARSAFIQAKEKPEIRGLYANEMVYINWHLKKEHTKKVKELKYFKGMNMPPFAVPFGMDMGQMMMPFMPPQFPQFPQFRPDYMGYGGRPRGFEYGGPPNQRPFSNNQRPFTRPGGPGFSGGPRQQKAPYNPRGPRQYPPGGKPQNKPQGPPIGPVGGLGVPPQIEKPLQQPNAPASMTPSTLRENMQDFLKLEKNKQRDTLGNMLFPRIKKYADDEMAPKITGMLIDFSVFEVQDIIEFLENEESLKEKIEEARELIQSQAN